MSDIHGKWDIDLTLPERLKLTHIEESLQVISYGLLHEKFWFMEQQHPCAECSMTFGEDTFCIVLKTYEKELFTCVKCNYCGSTTSFDHKDLEGMGLP